MGQFNYQPGAAASYGIDRTTQTEVSYAPHKLTRQYPERRYFAQITVEMHVDVAALRGAGIKNVDAPESVTGRRYSRKGIRQ